MRLADLVDLEAQLARDATASPQRLAARDAPIAAAGALSARPPAEALAGWLSALRAAEPDRLHPGERVEAALRWSRLLLVVAGLALGWGAMTALVEASRPHPVNVWSFLLAFVLGQLILFLFTAAGAAAALRPGRPSPPGPVHELLGALVERLAGRAFRDGERLKEWRALGHRLRARRNLYGQIEPWQLLALGQAFGVAFNVAAALALVRLVVFTDVAFSWSTTLSALDPASFHAVVSRLAWPWGWAFPDAVPARQVVEATRYWHLEGRYDGTALGQALHPELRGAWWPFLLAALLTYGLLPRVAMLLLAGWRRRGELAALPPGDAETSAVLRRLGLDDAASGRVHHPDDAGRHEPVAWEVVRWREAALDAGVEAALAARLGRRAERVRLAGGRAWEGGARPVLLSGGEAAFGRRGVALLAEAHQPPDKATLRFLREARAVLGRTAPMLVLLGEPEGETLGAPDAAQLATWRTRLARLEDAYLGVEPLRDAAPAPDPVSPSDPAPPPVPSPPGAAP